MITRGVLDMKVAILTALSGMLLMGATLPAFAETNRWAGYTGVDTQRYQHHPAYPQHRPYYSQHPQPQYYPRHYPQHHPRPAPQWGQPTIRSGINIQYNAPSTVQYNHQSYSWVNGEPSSAHIESSTYQVVTNWQHLGLPAPPRGMYWIFEDGRYVLVANR